MWDILGPILGILLVLAIAAYLIWVLVSWLTKTCDSPLDAFFGTCDEWEVRQGNSWDRF